MQGGANVNSDLHYGLTLEHPEGFVIGVNFDLKVPQGNPHTLRPWNPEEALGCPRVP